MQISQKIVSRFCVNWNCRENILRSLKNSGCQNLGRNLENAFSIKTSRNNSSKLISKVSLKIALRTLNLEMLNIFVWHTSDWELHAQVTMRSVFENASIHLRSYARWLKAQVWLRQYTFFYETWVIKNLWKVTWILTLSMIHWNSTILHLNDSIKKWSNPF